MNSCISIVTPYYIIVGCKLLYLPMEGLKVGMPGAVYATNTDFLERTL